MATEPQGTQEPTGAAPAPASLAPPEKGPEGHEKFTEILRRILSWIERAAVACFRSTKAAVDSGKLQPRMGVVKLEWLIAWARRVFPQLTFETLSGWFVKYGHAGLAASVVLSLLFGVVAAVKLSSWVYIGEGIGLAVMLVILQFTAEKFLNAGDTLIKASPSRLGSAAFLDCLALLAELAGIMGLLAYLGRAHDTEQWSLAWAGLGCWALGDAVACIALHPSMTNVSIDPSVHAGEEAIGIMSFLVKLVVRVMPMAFGVGAVIGAVGLLFGIGTVIRNGGLLGCYASIKLAAVCACLPFASYVLFAFYHLVIDLMQAILSLQGRRDRP